jgi:mRNA interferase RelE/StbE
MSYRIIFDAKAIEFLEKLPKHSQERIFKKIQTTKENPHRFFERLTERAEYKLRVGDYRVIAEIHDKETVILVLHIGHRRNIYDRMRHS